MSRNEERLLNNEPKQSDNLIIPSTNSEEQKIGSLDFVIPTEFVELPSKGKFYFDNLLQNKEDIEIRFMTAKDEDILTSKTLLKKGIAVDRFLQNIIVNKDIKLDSLLIGDKNAITIASRISGFGPEYNVKVFCPGCEEQVDYVFDLSEIKIRECDYSLLNEKNNLEIILPQTKVVAECKMLTGEDEKKISFILQKKRQNKLQENYLLEQFRLFIVSLNGETDRSKIERFLENMPARDSRHLRNTYQKSVPNIDIKQLFVCPNCGLEEVMEVPIGTNFFWPE